MSDTTNLGTAFVPAHVQDSALTYEQKLEQNLRWAMDEGSRHFEEKSAVHATLRRICKRLNEMEIPYAVVGGMALFKYGYRRFTEGVDILVTRESVIDHAHRAWLWLAPQSGALGRGKVVGATSLIGRRSIFIVARASP